MPDYFLSQDAATVQHNAEGHWKRFALLCQWPIEVTP